MVVAHVVDARVAVVVQVVNVRVTIVAHVVFVRVAIAVQVVGDRVVVVHVVVCCKPLVEATKQTPYSPTQILAVGTCRLLCRLTSNYP